MLDVVNGARSFHSFKTSVLVERLQSVGEGAHGLLHVLLVICAASGSRAAAMMQAAFVAGSSLVQAGSKFGIRGQSRVWFERMKTSGVQSQWHIRLISMPPKISKTCKHLFLNHVTGVKPWCHNLGVETLEAPSRPAQSPLPSRLGIQDFAAELCFLETHVLLPDLCICSYLTHICYFE